LANLENICSDWGTNGEKNRYIFPFSQTHNAEAVSENIEKLVDFYSKSNAR